MTLRGWLEVGGGVVVLVCAGIAWQQANQVREEALRADKAEALADTTRRLMVRAAVGRAVWQRRAVQETQRGDSIDRELGLTRKAFIAATLTIAQLDSMVWSEAVTEDTAGVRRANFHVRQEPYTADAAVALPPRPAAGSLALTVKLDPVPLDLRLECGAAGAGGVRPASAVLSGPPWATVQLGRVEQATEVCSPRPPLLNLGNYLRGFEAGGAVGAGLTLFLHFVLRLF